MEKDKNNQTPEEREVDQEIDKSEKSEKKKKGKVKTKKDKHKEIDKSKKLGRGIETMYRVCYRNHINLTALADRKANMMISTNTLVLSAILAAVGSGLAFEGIPLWQNKFAIPLAVLLLFSSGSVIYAIFSARSTITRVGVSREDILNNKASILFFGNFSSLALPEYLDDIKLLRDDDELLYNNMSIDIYFLGKVLDRKYQQIKLSYNLFLIGLLLAVITFVFIWIFVR